MKANFQNLGGQFKKVEGQFANVEKLVERSEKKVDVFYSAFKSYTTFLAKSQIQQRKADRKLQEQIATLQAEGSKKIAEAQVAASIEQYEEVAALAENIETSFESWDFGGTVY